MLGGGLEGCYTSSSVQALKDAETKYMSSHSSTKTRGTAWVTLQSLEGISLGMESCFCGISRGYVCSRPPGLSPGYLGSRAPFTDTGTTYCGVTSLLRRLPQSPQEPHAHAVTDYTLVGEPQLS